MCIRDRYRIGGDEFAVIITENTSQVEELIHGFDSNVANWHGKFVDAMTEMCIRDRPEVRQELPGLRSRLQVQPG